MSKRFVFSLNKVKTPPTHHQGMGSCSNAKINIDVSFSHSLCKSIYQHPLSQFSCVHDVDVGVGGEEKDVAITLHGNNFI